MVLVQLEAVGVSPAQFATLDPVNFAPTVTIDSAGVPLPFSWRPVPGGTGARVESAPVRVLPSTGGDGRDVGVVCAGGTTTTFTVRLPAGDTLLRGLRIPSLVRHDGEDEFPINGQEDLGDHHLVVRPFVNGQVQAPVVAVRPVQGGGMLPAQLAGGSLSGSLLRLPDLVGGRFEVSLCSGSAPDDFEPVTISFGDVRGLVAPQPSSVSVEDPTGAVAIAFEGPGVAMIALDLGAPLQRHLGEVVPDPAVSRADGRVVAAGPGSAQLRWSPDVTLLRAVDGRVSVTLTGEPAHLDLGVPAAGRDPLLTRADLTITHDGLALHPLSDPVPAQPAGLSGPVVTATPVTRALPPEALLGFRVGRVGVVGRVVAAADLTLTLECGQARPTAVTLSELDAATGPGNEVWWFPLDEAVMVSGPVRVSLAATRGRFCWVATAEDGAAPAVRWAVVTEPAGTRVTIAGTPVTLTGIETSLTGATVAGPSPLPVTTDQFCTVAASSAVQEFAP
jgi:hypothetical protein